MSNKKLALLILFVVLVVFAFSWFAKNRVEEINFTPLPVEKILPEPSPTATKDAWEAWCKQNPKECKG